MGDVGDENIAIDGTDTNDFDVAKAVAEVTGIELPSAYEQRKSAQTRAATRHLEMLRRHKDVCRRVSEKLEEARNAGLLSVMFRVPTEAVAAITWWLRATRHRYGVEPVFHETVGVTLRVSWAESKK